MNKEKVNDQRLWRQLVGALVQELRGVSAAERAWMEEGLAEIARIQEAIHVLFEKGGGKSHCRSCGGACCDRGKYYPTLVNILPYLLEGGRPPEPDFSSSCPFLHRQSCLLPPPRRPFICITFFCEPTLQGLSAGDRTLYLALEKELRSRYQVFDGRYAGSSPGGLLNRGPALGDRPLLGRC
ncbi:hypothetical protein [Desulfuromonas soudanensis]|uniref:hypothetical protein n=1 Tax=Desulfuromonas soudanensis TaxID=1603606 RepID=UPI0006AD1C9C|nr:hypothetical protein [Desulfuromonas soudanensis]